MPIKKRDLKSQEKFEFKEEKALHNFGLFKAHEEDVDQSGKFSFMQSLNQ